MKHAASASVKPRVGPSRQTLPLEKCSVFVSEKKRTSDPKESIKQMVGRYAAREYYASRPAQKGGMRQEVFGTVAWDNVGEALKQDVKNVVCKTRFGALPSGLLDEQLGENGQDDKREGARVL